MMNSQAMIEPSLRSNSLSSPLKSLHPLPPPAPAPQQQQPQQQQQQQPPSAQQQQQHQQPHPHQPQQQYHSPLQASPGRSSHPAIQTPSYYHGSSAATQNSPSDHAGDQSPSSGAVHNPDDLKRPRACEACRQLKVKCEIDDNSPDGVCKRCAKAHRQCIITVPSRKRQKKTDSRVAELEKKIDALTASLAARGGHPESDGLDPTIAAQQHYQHRGSVYGDQWHPQGQPHMRPVSPPNPAQIVGTKRKSTDPFGPFGGELQKPPASVKQEGSIATSHLSTNDHKPMRVSVEPPTKDLIDRGLIDAKIAYKCFDRYVNEMCHRLPVVVFPPGTQAEEIRQSKPILFHAIVAVACGAIRPELQSGIISEATRILADRVVYNGEKSMELVQTIQIMTVFYQPPERYEELNFNQLIHIAAVMALDIGMGKRTRKGPPPTLWKNLMDKNKSLPDPNAVDTRRCWLGCYYMCSNSAMSLRRPLLVRWSPYADECIEILRTSQDALPTDRFLCHIVQAQHIAEMIGTEFAMDDPAQELLLTDLTTQHKLKGLESILEQWQRDGDEFMKSPIMRHTKAIINLYMHEPAMHNEHNIDDFRPPYHSTPIEGPPDPESVTPVHIESLSKCLASVHEAFDAFLSMDVNTLRSLPTHFFVRNSYAAVALIKLYTAIAAKESKFGTIFRIHELKVEHYLDELIATLAKVAEGGMSRVAYKFSLIFQMLRQWHLKRTEAPSGRGSREQSLTRIPSKAIITRAPTYDSTPHPQTDQQQKQHASQQQQHQQQLWQQNLPSGQAVHRNGLQMLSDAAMNPNGRPTPSQQIPVPNQGQWISSPPPPQHQPSHLNPGQPPPLTTGPSMQPGPGHPMHGEPGPNGVPMVMDPMMAGTYGMAPEPTSFMDFTSDELMAYGFGEEFLAMNFGFDQGGGWAL